MGEEEECHCSLPQSEEGREGGREREGYNRGVHADVKPPTRALLM